MDGENASLAVTPYLGVAMVIHGLYNAVAMIFSLAE